MSFDNNELMQQIPNLNKTAVRLVRNSNYLPEDLINDALVNALDHREEFSEGNDLKAWLIRIMELLVRAYKKSVKLFTEFEQDLFILQRQIFSIPKTDIIEI